MNKEYIFWSSAFYSEQKLVMVLCKSVEQFSVHILGVVVTHSEERLLAITSFGSGPKMTIEHKLSPQTLAKAFKKYMITNTGIAPIDTPLVIFQII